MDGSLASSSQTSRLHLNTIILDTTALLNVVKHCREADLKQGAQGVLMGVLKVEESGGDEKNLMITQSIPQVNKASLEEITQAMENESQRLMDTNKVGFYMSVYMGLTFNNNTLLKLIDYYKQYKNSVVLVYDLSKSNYGLNPLHAFRLSQKAIDCLNLQQGLLESTSLVQDKIRTLNLTVAEFFEEVPIKIYRSHLCQAFLFDHIQMHMPAFNSQLFKLATPQYLCNYVYKLNEATEELVLEQQKIEQQQRQIMSTHKKQLQSGAATMGQTIDDSHNNKMDFFLLSRQVEELCGQIVDFGIPDKLEKATEENKASH